MINKIIYCGSCGRPMKTQKDFGKELDGSSSSEYCYSCYQNSEWTEPDISFYEFYKKSRKAFLESDMNKFQKLILKKMYTQKFVSSLKRWK